MLTIDPPPADVSVPGHLHSPFGTLLAQTRQADRDKAAAEDLARMGEAQRRHVEDQIGGLREIAQTNTALTRRIAELTDEIHVAACGPPAAPPAQA